MRTPVSAAVLGGMLIVICDDGSVWELDPSNGWVEREPIPGTRQAIPEHRMRRRADAE